MKDIAGACRHLGPVVSMLGFSMLASALLGSMFNLSEHPLRPATEGVMALVVPGALLALLGWLGTSWGTAHREKWVSRREAILAVAVIWLAAGVFGAVPYVLGSELSAVDAFFESMSGFTTTGATILTDIEGTMTRPLLLWRSMTQWFGGMGIVVLFVAVFPTFGAGGKHMFGEEVPGTSAEGLKPRIRETSRILWLFYLAFTLIEIVLLAFCGMSLFEAVCHGLTTLSTGGFSTRDASVAAFASPAVEWVIAVFMLLASVNYGLYFSLFRNKTLREFIRSLEFRVFVTLVVSVTLIITFWTVGRMHASFHDAFRYAAFTVGTFVSSTGFGIEDYMAYPPPILLLILALMFSGGCAGSTAGGIKLERLILMAKLSWTQIRRSHRPNLVHAVRMGSSVVEPHAIADVSVFLVIFFGCLGAGSFLVCLFDPVPVQAAVGAMLSSLSNMGPAPYYVGSDNFAAYSGASKMVFVAGMVLGRLEFFTLLALLAPGFWRR